MPPGVCSNPEPTKDIAERPLGSIDIAWYMLAESELMSRRNVGILNGLYDRLSDGPISMLEISLRSKRLAIEIEDMNPTGFARHLLGHVEGMAYLSNNAQEIRQQSNLLNPARATIPVLSPSEVQPAFAPFVNDAVFAYAISCACRLTPESLLELAATLDAHFGRGVMGGAIFSRASSGGHRSPSASFEDALVDSVMTFWRGFHATPLEYCVAGLRFLQQAQRSSFRASLVPIIATWQRNAWTRIVSSERFQLVQPQRTVPAIEAALSSELNNERFLCSLLLATADASKVVIPHDVRTQLERVAD
jgi:hypothetical protein